MEERNYKLYVHISPSNKRYYGITVQTVQDRWQNGYGYRTQPHFYNAINKYGWDNIEHIVLFDNLTKEEACLLEQCYITLYNTTNDKYGYNSTYGGEHYIPSERTREKMSISNKIAQNRPDVKQRKSERTKGEKNPMYGKHLTEEHKQKLRDNSRWINAKEEAHIKASNTFKNIWQQKTQEQRDKQIGGMRTKESQEKAIQNRLKKLPLVLCVETGQLFDNLQQAADWAKCSKENIRCACVGRQDKAKGYHWEYIIRQEQEAI